MLDLLSFNRELARCSWQLEARLDRRLADHDEARAAILSANQQLISPSAPRRRPIDFTANLDANK